jgi:hypothetical protein
MEIVYERCAGLGVHKKNVKACFSGPGKGGQRTKETRTYLTMTQDLLQLRDWLKEQGCTHIALEATGVYWRPIYNLLEGDFEILVVNAHHIKTVPGRKTDVRDAEWIADLLAHGLLAASFIPSAPQRELRELTLYWLLRSSVQKRDLASRMRRMRSVSVGGGRFTCRLSITSCWRKSAFSAISRDLLLRRSVRVPAARRSRRFGPTSKARGERIQAAILQPLESGENTTHSRSFSIA